MALWNATKVLGQRSTNFYELWGEPAVEESGLVFEQVEPGFDQQPFPSR